jgi:hypothetical protein
MWATIDVTQASDGEVRFGLTCTTVSGGSGYGLAVTLKAPPTTTVGWRAVTGGTQDGRAVTVKGVKMREVGQTWLPPGSTCRLYGAWSTTQAWTARVYLTFDMDGDGPEPTDVIYSGPGSLP